MIHNNYFAHNLIGHYKNIIKRPAIFVLFQLIFHPF